MKEGNNTLADRKEGNKVVMEEPPEGLDELGEPEQGSTPTRSAVPTYMEWTGGETSVKSLPANPGRMGVCIKMGKGQVTP